MPIAGRSACATLPASSWARQIIPSTPIYRANRPYWYSLDNLSLFGLVLAIGIVVDDAIVVVENVGRNLARGLTPLQAAFTSMDEVAVAIVAVLCAVFIPTLFSRC